jgi:carbon storage regulator
MLVLSRKKGQQIVVDDIITITVVEIRGKNVRLGITAPRHIPVDRQEIHLARQMQSGPTSLPQPSRLAANG